YFTFITVEKLCESLESDNSTGDNVVIKGGDDSKASSFTLLISTHVLPLLYINIERKGISYCVGIQGACAGARQLEVTINGIGERAGNASLEEVVMTIKCHGQSLGGLYTGIQTEHIVKASKMILSQPYYKMSF
ncbi:hypothetical protein SOVF_115620, partial [Spinacia oleracea]